LPAQTYEIIERGLIVPVAKPRCDAEGMLKNYDPFLHEDLHYITKFYRQKCAKNTVKLVV